MKFLVPVARITFALVFLLAVLNHFSEGVQTRANIILSFAEPFFGILAIWSALSIMFGFKVRWTAWFMMFFVVYDFIIHAYLDHNPTDLKFVLSRNLSLLAASMFLAYFGAGPISIDRENKIRKRRFRRYRRTSKTQTVLATPSNL